MQSTHDMIRQADKELRRADVRLNNAYKKLLATLDAIGQAKLRKSQRAWIAYRDANADWHADIFRDGTGAEPIRLSSLAQITQERAKELEQALDDRNR